MMYEEPIGRGRAPRLFLPLLVASLLAAGLVPFVQAVAQDPGDTLDDLSVLVFSKTTEFRHDSIEDGARALREIGDENGFSVEHTEDAAAFAGSNLAGYGAVVFLNTSGDVLNDEQQAAFERYIQEGGGYVGIHAAADTEYEWAWYGRLVGAYFESHPHIQEADIAVLDRTFPATAHLPARWTRTDEWYDYKANPRGEVHVLATLVEKSYEGGKMGDDHPIAWAHEYDGGRALYTGGGHTSESYEEPLFREHLLQAMLWAAGRVDGDVGATLQGSYEEVVLDGDTTYPMQLEVAPDGRVFWIERDGAVKIWDPAIEATVMAGWIPTSMKIEDGLLGIALDPNFEENNWVYFYYMPLSQDPNRLSRFTMRGNRLDMGSEVIVLEVFMQRELCCHSAGELHFDKHGDLWLATGDNTGGVAPRTDERPGRSLYDAQRTSANTNDLRGKVLRIRPQPDGSYTIPEGNLFEDDDPLTRPEIYTMGHRNPWRITVDAETGWMYWGDVGPGSQYVEGKIPQGMEEFGQARTPGFFGWPYFVGPNASYRDLNFETEEYGGWYDPETPINDSPNNTGLRELPPAQLPWIYYSYGPSAAFPEMGVGGMSAAPGFVYRYDPEIAGARALPEYFDGKVILFEWARNWIQEALNDEYGDVLEITAFTPEIPYTRPVDVALGPDQTLYVLEWGQEFWGHNRDGQLVRIDYYGNKKRPPQALATAEPLSGPSPLAVAFDGSASASRNGGALHFSWDFDGDGVADAETPTAEHIYAEPGTHTARLAVTDPEGMVSETEITVAAGNTAPEVSIAWPPFGGIAPMNTAIPYEVQALDAEEGMLASPGSRITLQPFLGHDTHERPLHMHRGNTGAFNVVPDPDNGPYIIDRYVRLVASYTDSGTPALTSSAEAILYPNVVQAENRSMGEGDNLVITGNRQRPGFPDETEVYLEMEHAEHVSFSAMNLHGVHALALYLVPEAEGAVQVRLDAADGPILAETAFSPPEESRIEEREDGPPVIHWMSWSLPIEAPEGARDLYVVFQGPERGVVARFDRIEFEGPGVTRRPGGISILY